jgi:hypothetical protein
MQQKEKRKASLGPLFLFAFCKNGKEYEGNHRIFATVSVSLLAFI